MFLKNRMLAVSYVYASAKAKTSFEHMFDNSS